MGRNTRKRRSPLAVRAVAASAALAIGGGGLIWANFYASAHETNSSPNTVKAAAAQVATISCPDIGQKLTNVPANAKSNVDAELATLDKQITEAYARLASSRQAQANDAGFVQNAILSPLQEKRNAVIGRIKIDFTRVGAAAPTTLDGLAACTGTTAAQAQTTAGGQNNGGQNNNGQNNGGQQNNGQNNGGQQNNGGAQASAAPSASAPANIGGQAGNGPVAADFVDITKVAPNVLAKPQKTGQASRGTFTTQCGVNANKNHNTDNVIVAPGVTNGAHHLHDYVGNQKVNAFSSNNTFLQGGTSCQNKNDLSSYYWPVVRLQNGTQDFDQNADGGGKEGNVGKILTPVQAQIKYVGSPASKVVAMPQFLRIITGDAKTTTNGLANANAHWSCTGFENKVQLTSQYPICPQGSNVVRTFAFQSCWDGQNIDSANHRTHVAFADPASGVCGNGFKAIPQLTMRLVYKINAPTLQNGVVKNAYAVDGFPEQLHKSATDHDDFIAVTTGGLANKIASCINSGKQCR
ncbi:DUF1996 domain-containing protein [Streptomyces sp. NPDC059837]|jgi:hypothetical protein|uniref:DUF1996 domain-containing protein n=1 Tax=unclassified Streptomyces TaxID=2593676 RepID=UPI00224DD874|nr:MULTISPECIES: DUF1996 domain-containing protein [unclassified Streptomyces]MCX4401190.1 DUF1996 domain-containing protein [Streptomyces sp. NBC_01764]MCX5184151.1 DUF1996 domain-containing protein [Streptomyces sp. NBC_00268]